MQAISVLVLMNISISVSNMILTLVSSVWTSTLFSAVLVRELPVESTLVENSENSNVSQLKKPSNGLPKNVLVPSYEQHD